MIAEFLDLSEFIVLQIFDKWFYDTTVSRAQGLLRFSVKLCYLHDENPSEFYTLVGKAQARYYSLDSWPNRYRIKRGEDGKIYDAILWRICVRERF